MTEYVLTILVAVGAAQGSGESHQTFKTEAQCHEAGAQVLGQINQLKLKNVSFSYKCEATRK